MRILPVSVTICAVLLLEAPLIAQDHSGGQSRLSMPRSLDWYDSESRSAIRAENYETAVRILKEGIELYPSAVDLTLRLADLYYSKELYNLALIEYKAARDKIPDDFYTLNRIQRCHGYLNQNRDAVQVLERIVSLFPENEDSAVDLGWMYFKTHQLEKGERILLKAMQSFGQTRSLSMTLGTIYSDMYRYNESKDYYLKSIQEAISEGDTAFASVAYYNLSLLERGFYHYNSALRYTELSIGQQDRPTGHLSKGELFQSQLHFRDALAEYQRGLAMDDSPLTKINLAILYQKFGLLDYARRYAEEVFSLKDVSWMHSFGTDRDLHLKEVYELLADIYRGLAHKTRLSPSRNLWERLLHWANSIGYHLKSNWYRRQFRNLSLKVGKDYLAKGNDLDAFWEFYRANEPYRKVALKYLHRARDIEIRVKPHAAAYYLQEEGKVTGSASKLEASIKQFDRFWEREAISDSLIEMVRLAKKRSVFQRETLNRLYEINPGALLQIGYGVPLRVTLHLTSQPAGTASGGPVPGGGDRARPSLARPDLTQTNRMRSSLARPGLARRDPNRLERILMKMLRQTGSEIIPTQTDGPDEEGFRYELQIGLSGNTAWYRLLDGDAEKSLSNGQIEIQGQGATEICYGLVTQLLERIYGVR